MDTINTKKSTDKARQKCVKSDETELQQNTHYNDQNVQTEKYILQL